MTSRFTGRGSDGANPSPRAVRGWAVIAAALGLFAGASADAFNGFRQTLPNTSTTSLSTGLKLDIDAYWYEDGGYRPVRLRFEAAATKNRDRVIDFELLTAKRNRSEDPVSLAVKQRLVLPAGETTVEETLYLPGYHQGSSIWWTVVVDGQEDKFLSLGRRTALPLNTTNNQQAALRRLRFSPRLERRGNAALSRRSTLRSYDDLSGMLVDDATAAPMNDWLDYSATDIVSLDLAALRQKSEESPEAIAAIRRWCLAGGMIWVEKVGSNSEALLEISQLLDLGSWDLDLDSPPGVQLSALPQAAGWRRESLMKKATTAGDVAKQIVDQAQQGGLSSALQAAQGGPDSRGWYAVHGAGLGRVYAFQRDGFDWPGRITNAVAENATKRWSSRGWAPRHGVKPDVASPDFANLLIPDVGFAPVGEFQVLITLFVLGIGPLNYWLLYRAQRLDLFVVTTPLVALAVTLALFSYATLSDGFGVRVRARTLTVLNQGEGQAVTWARLCHYAGLGSRGGFSMPDDAMVFPIRVGWENAVGAGQESSRELFWTDDAQQLVSGWMPARTSVQHLVVRSGPVEERLQFGEPTDDRLEARNELGADLLLLLARDADGDWWIAEEADADAVVELEPIVATEAIATLRKLTLENQPSPPVGSGRAVEDALERLGARQNVRAIERQLANVSPSSNLMNNAINRVAGLEGGTPLNLPPRTYVAVSDETITAALGFEEVKEAGSFHMVVGTW